jgi:hypothetical protein
MSLAEKDHVNYIKGGGRRILEEIRRNLQTKAVLINKALPQVNEYLEKIRKVV